MLAVSAYLSLSLDSPSAEGWESVFSAGDAGGGKNGGRIPHPLTPVFKTI